MTVKADPDILKAVLEQVEIALAGSVLRPVIIGLCGAQGSGKTTLAAEVLEECQSRGLRGAVLSIDDLYLAHAERQDLAREVHPLLATRGVPGTHDVRLGLSVVAGLRKGEEVPLPRFDKGRDDPVPRNGWPLSPAHCEVLLFEGWCVGARPQETAALAEPVNALEIEEDPEARWRTYANAALAGLYAQLFSMIDRLVLLAAPDFEIVQTWRLQQEQGLDPSQASSVMDAAAVSRFVRHYERLTRHILDEMPARADLVIHLDTERRARAITKRA